MRTEPRWLYLVDDDDLPPPPIVPEPDDDEDDGSCSCCGDTPIPRTPRRQLPGQLELEPAERMPAESSDDLAAMPAAFSLPPDRGRGPGRRLSLTVAPGPPP